MRSSSSSSSLSLPSALPLDSGSDDSDTESPTPLPTRAPPYSLSLVPTSSAAATALSSPVSLLNPPWSGPVHSITSTVTSPSSYPTPSPVSSTALLSQPTSPRRSPYDEKDDPTHWHDVRDTSTPSPALTVSTTCGVVSVDVRSTPAFCEAARCPSPEAPGSMSWAASASMVPLDASFIVPAAFGVWAEYSALCAAVCCGVFAPFALWWWAADVSPFYNPVCNLVAGCACIAAGLLVWYEERAVLGLGPLLLVGDFCDATVSRYHFRSLLYLLLSIPLFLSWPTLVPAATLVTTAAINRVACAHGEQFSTGRQRYRQREQFGLGWRLWATVKDTVWKAVHLHRMNLLGVVVWSLLYAGLNVSVFVVTTLSWKSQVDASVHQVTIGLVPSFMAMSYWIAPAKAFGLLLNINFALVLLPMCRSLTGCLYQWSTQDQRCGTRALRLLLKLVPLDFPVAAHAVVGVVIVLCSIGHSVSHLGNLARAYPWTLSTLGGPWALISGGFLCVLLFLLCTSSFLRVRLAQYSVFLELHHLFVALYAVLLVHGAGGMGPNFWKYAIGPLFLYAVERFWRVHRGDAEVCVLSATLRDEVLCLEFARGGLAYHTGQYVLLQCPALSSLQWHPFTISSAPSDATVTVHIKVSTLKPSSFTYRLRAFLATMRPRQSHSIDRAVYIPFDRPDPDTSAGVRRKPGRVTGPDGRPLFRIQGPHSAPTQHLTEQPVSVVIGAGIGGTVLSACLRQVVHHDWMRNVGECFPSTAYFVWLLPHRHVHSYHWLIKLIRETQDRVDHMRAVGLMHGKHFELHVYVTSAPSQAERHKAKAALRMEMKAAGHQQGLVRAPSGPGLSRMASTTSLLSPRGRAGSADPELGAPGKLGDDVSWMHSPAVTPHSAELSSADYELALTLLDPPTRAKAASAKWPPRIPASIDTALSRSTSLRNVFVYDGRPEWANMFQVIAARHGDASGVGVMFCGPPAVGSDVRGQCWERNVKMGKLHFKMYAENF